MRWKTFIALTRKNSEPAEQLTEEEQLRGSTGYVFFGMRMPSLQEAQEFLAVKCGRTLGERTVWRVDLFNEEKAPRRIVRLDDTTFYPVFDWDKRIFPVSESGYNVQVVTGIAVDSNGVDACSLIIGQADGIDPGDVVHDLALDLDCGPSEVENGHFQWENEVLPLPPSVVAGIQKCAKAETLRSLGRYVNDIYLSETPAENDSAEEKQKKALRCEGIKLVLDVISEKLGAEQNG